MGRFEVNDTFHFVVLKGEKHPLEPLWVSALTSCIPEEAFHANLHDWGIEMWGAPLGLEKLDLSIWRAVMSGMLQSISWMPATNNFYQVDPRESLFRQNCLEAGSHFSVHMWRVRGWTMIRAECLDTRGENSNHDACMVCRDVLHAALDTL